MNITTLTRLTKAYKTIGNTFGTWFAPIITGILVIIIRILVTAGRILDHIFFPNAFIKPITKPIMIVGNPRSGTTFIHRYLVDSKIGTGNQLWQMLYPSIILQKIASSNSLIINSVTNDGSDSLSSLIYEAGSTEGTKYETTTLAVSSGDAIGDTFNFIGDGDSWFLRYDKSSTNTVTLSNS